MTTVYLGIFAGETPSSGCALTEESLAPRAPGIKLHDRENSPQKNTKIRINTHSTAFGYLQITLAQNRIAEWQFPISRHLHVQFGIFRYFIDEHYDGNFSELFAQTSESEESSQQ
jgi:hypothetical protein